MARRKPDPVPVDATPLMKLSPEAQALVADVSGRWNLDAAAAALLRLAAEAMTRAQECGAIVSAEGAVYKDRWGQPQKHPASLLERDHRAAAAASLQKLTLHLES